MLNNSELVYSTNPDLNKPCPRCKKLAGSCTCKSVTPDISKIKALLRIEKKHRGGKDVTIIDRLPPSEEFLKDLSTTLKKKCGTGGTFRIDEGVGSVEIQGDKRTQIKVELEKMGIFCK